MADGEHPMDVGAEASLFERPFLASYETGEGIKSNHIIACWVS
jgi:hypothetical protein